MKPRVAQVTDVTLRNPGLIHFALSAQKQIQRLNSLVLTERGGVKIQCNAFLYDKAPYSSRYALRRSLMK